MHRGYDECDGPPRDPSHSLETWHAAQDDAAAERRAEERRAAQALPDLYQVADKVLAPLMGGPLRAVPRRLGTAARDALEARGEKPTRENLLLEAARFLAQEQAATDPELAVALLLRAALLFRPAGGWSRQAPRRARGEGFGSLGALLGAAFSELAIGQGVMSLEVAQNRARTRSLGHEVFVQASHSGTSRARNADAVDRRTDAQALIYRSQVDLQLLPLLFERHVLGRYRERAELLDELRHREAQRRQVALPGRPARWGLARVGTRRDGTVIAVPRDPPAGLSDAEVEQVEAEERAWQLAVGVALWGMDLKQEAHIRKSDRGLLRPVEEAEDALLRAIGQPRRVSTRASRPVEVVEALVPRSAAEALADG